jgi:chromosome segregation ATPase
MLSQDQHITALEKDVIAMKQDIIYKLDDTNSAITIIKGVVGNISQDVRILNIRVDGIDKRLDRLEEKQNAQGQDIKAIKHHLESFEQRFTSLEDQQNAQGRDIKAIKHHLEGLEQRFTSLEQRLTSLEEKVEQRFTSLEERFTSLEGKFEQVLQLLTIQAQKAEL